MYPIPFGLVCDFRNDPTINSLLQISSNGGGDGHGSLDVLPSTQYLNGNGHWETLELYLVRTFIFFHECCFKKFPNTTAISVFFLSKIVIGLPGKIWPCI